MYSCTVPIQKRPEKEHSNGSNLTGQPARLTLSTLLVVSQACSPRRLHSGWTHSPIPQPDTPQPPRVPPACPPRMGGSTPPKHVLSLIDTPPPQPHGLSQCSSRRQLEHSLTHTIGKREKEKKKSSIAKEPLESVSFRLFPFLLFTHHDSSPQHLFVVYLLTFLSSFARI